MALSTLENLKRVASVTAGIGALTLGAAVSGYNDFTDIPDSTVVTYGIDDGANRELGQGVISAAGTVLTRTTVIASTNAGSPINCSGNEQVFLTVSSLDIQRPGDSVGLPDGTIAAPSLHSLANPDTGVSFDGAGVVISGAGIDTLSIYDYGAEVRDYFNIGGTNWPWYDSVNYGNNANFPVHSFKKTRGATGATHVIVQDGDILGELDFVGSDGTIYQWSSFVRGVVNGTPAAGNIPTDLVFFTGWNNSNQYERLRIQGTTGTISSESSVVDPEYQLLGFGNNAHYGSLQFKKTRGATRTAHTIVQNGDWIGEIDFAASDGTAFKYGANISAFIDGTPAANNVPIDLTISTGPNQGAMVEHVRIKNDGRIGLGNNPYPANSSLLHISRTTVAANLDPTLSPGFVFAEYGTGTPSNINYYVNINNVNNDGYGDGFNGFYARGTASAFLAVQNGDELFSSAAWGWTGTQRSAAVSWGMGVDGTVTATNVPGKFYLATRNAAGVKADRFTVYASGDAEFTGNVGIGTTPAVKLDINGISRIKGGFGLYLNNAGDTTNYYLRNNADIFEITRNGGPQILALNSQGDLVLGNTANTIDLSVVTTTSNNAGLKLYDTTDAGWTMFSQGGNLRVAKVNTAGAWVNNVIELDLNGASINAGKFYKDRNAASAQRWVFQDCGGLTGDTSGAFWRGLMAAGPTITQSAANRFPVGSIFWEFDTLTDPTNRKFVISPGNLDASAIASIVFRSNDTTDRVTIDPANGLNINTGGLLVGGGLRLAQVGNYTHLRADDNATYLDLGNTTAGKSIFAQADAFQFRLADGATYIAKVNTAGLTMLNGQIIARNGSAASPALSFISYQTTGLYVQDINTIGFATNGVKRFIVGSSSSVIFDASGNAMVSLNTNQGSIEMGQGVLGSNPFIDLHSSATTANDYDVRIQSFGGTAVSGQGTLQVTASVHKANSDFAIKTGGYLNWNISTIGTSGYGFFDNSGIIQLKNSGGTWQNIQRGPVLNLADYATLNAALAALPSTGGTIYVPAGVWNQTTTRAVVSGKNGGINLIGEGAGQSVLKWTGANGGLSITFTGNKSTKSDQKCIISNLSFLTTYASGTTGSGTAIQLIWDTIQSDGSLGGHIDGVHISCETNYAPGGGNYCFWNRGIELVNARQYTVRDSTYIGMGFWPSIVTNASTTSITIGTGTKVFTVASGSLEWYVGMSVTVYDNANYANFMEGYVSAYSGTSLTVEVSATGGSGTKTAWDIGPYGASGDGSINNKGMGVHMHGLSVACNLENFNATDCFAGLYLDGEVEGIKSDGMQAINAVYACYSDGQAPSVVSTSSTSMTIGTGSKSFTMGTGKDFWPGSFISIYDSANSANFMKGTVTSYNSGSGATVVNVTSIGGSGTKTSWDVLYDQYISLVVLSNGSYACVTNAWWADHTVFGYFYDNEVQTRGGNVNYADIQLQTHAIMWKIHDNLFTDYLSITAPFGVSVQGDSTNQQITVSNNTFRARNVGIWFHTGASTNSLVIGNLNGGAVTTLLQNDAAVNAASNF